MYIKSIILSLSFLYAINTYAQEELPLAKSDSLFARGVELYNQERYEEAIPIFIESDRIDKAVLDSTSNRRDYSAMWLASCYFSLGDIVTAQDIDPNFYCFTPIDRRLTVESDSLYCTGIDNYIDEDYTKAIECISKCAEIEVNVVGDQHMWYGSTLNKLGEIKLQAGQEDGVKDIERYCDIVSVNYGENSEEYILALEELCGYYYSYIGSYDEAIRIGTKILDIIEKRIGKDNYTYSLVLHSLARFNSDSGNYDKAVELETETLRIQENIMGKESPEYAASLNNLALYNSYLGNYNEAVRLGDEVLNIQERILGKEHPDCVTSLSNLALYNWYVGNHHKAIELGTEALNIQEKVLGKEHPSYANSLSNLASYYSSSGNYNEAVSLGTEALNIKELTIGKNNPDYSISLANLAKYNSYLGNYNEAIQLGLEALSIYENTVGKEHPNYASILNNLADYNCGIGNYIEAIRLGTEALNISEKILGKQSPDYANILSNLAKYNYYLGNYTDALKLGTEALSIREKILGKEHPLYARSVHDLASYNSDLGNYNEAIRLGIEALNIQRMAIGKEHPDYASSLNSLALHNSDLGNYTEAIRLGTEALNIRENTIGKEHPDYAMSLSNLALYNSYLGNYSEAIELGIEALNIQEKVLGKEHPTYANSLSNLAGYYSDLGDNNEAITLGVEALNIRENTIGKVHPDYANSLNNLATYYSELGNYTEAIRLGNEALNIWNTTLGEHHGLYITSLSNLAYYNFLDCNTDRLELYTAETNKLRTELVRKAFVNLTGPERRNFWNLHRYWYEKISNEFSHRYPTPVLVGNAFDATLVGKGILLNSEIDFSRLIQESNDAEAISTFKELRNTRRMLDRLYEKPIAERSMDTDSLENVAKELERTLLAKSKVYGDFTHNMTIGWKDVQKKLRPKDVAIEFVSFPTETDSVIYAAYILKIGMDSPLMVTLFEEKQLNGLSRSDLYTSKDASSLIWGKLDEYTADADNIYFAPAGELYNIAIEALPEPHSDGLISDHHNMYRLSSTRELAVLRDKNTPREAALYGGMQYDSDVKTMEDDSERYPDVQRDLSLLNLADSLNLRAGASNLPATQTEVENIDRSLKQTTIKSHLYTGTDGTEGSFKALSGKKTGMMHIATHGFYWTQSEARRMNRLNFLQSWDNSLSRHEEDKALTRSGLLFTGANNALTGKPLPENAQDGILTAKEISELDLRGLDMVVLSACQTGLGEITGDGVFGLQRGFKKAGANTLLMSLWKVDDRATQMLMNKFYEHFLSGKSKRESLVLAQKYLREYEEEETEDDDSELTASQQRRKEHSNEIPDETTPRKIKVKPYTHPRYWAAFILLDALD